MNLQSVYERYAYYSGRTSEIVRTLGLAGIGVVWIFVQITDDQQVVVPPDLLLAGVLVVASLAADLLHYLGGTIAWGVFHRHKDAAETPAAESFDAPRFINWPANIFFWLKVVLIGAAYAQLLRFLIGRMTM